MNYNLNGKDRYVFQSQIGSMFMSFFSFDYSCYKNKMTDEFEYT